MVLSEDHPLPKDIFKDKVVFVGLNLKSRTGPSQREAFMTPYDANTFGTELHATATSNLLKRDWLRRLSPRRELLLMGGVAAVFTFLFLALSGLSLLAGLPIFIAGVMGVQYWFFFSGLVLPLVTPIGCGMFFGLLARIMLGNPLYGSFRRK
jgi:CHASE2 domain-containing sensor protein